MAGISSKHTAVGLSADFWIPNPASTYLFVTLAQQSLEKQHQLGERGSDLKLLFPALLHDLIAGERDMGLGCRGRARLGWGGGWRLAPLGTRQPGQGEGRVMGRCRFL